MSDPNNISALEIPIAAAGSAGYVIGTQDGQLRRFLLTQLPETFTTPKFPGSLSFGVDNTQTSLNSIQGGRQNDQSGVNNLQVGITNTQSGGYSTQSGYGNHQTGSYSSQSGYGNTQSGSYSSQIGYSNTQSGRYNSQSGTYSVQTGDHGAQFGIELDDGGFDYTYMFGKGPKVATVSDAMFIWTDNGIRLKPLAVLPALPEDGTVAYYAPTHKFRGYANGVWVDLH